MNANEKQRLCPKTLVNWIIYINANREAKNAMTFTWVTNYQLLYDDLKYKIYRSTIHPVAHHGSEYWGTRKNNERRLALIETKMLR